MKIHQHIGVAGRFRVIKHRVDENGVEIPGSREDLGFPNLITNSGLDELAGGGWITHVRIGTGSTPPSNGDTALVSQVAVSSSNASTNATSAGNGTWSAMTFTWVFAQGAVVGNIAELGASTGAAASLFSRALVVDGAGNPTTISVTAIDILTVIYELRFYWDVSDKVQTVTINSVEYTMTSRMCQSSAQRVSGWRVFGHSGDTSQASTSPLTLVGGTPALGPITGDLIGGTGAVRSSANPTLGAYTAGSYTRSQTWSIATADGNIAGGIRGWSMWEGNNRRSVPCQTIVTPAIPKDSTKTMTITVVYTWGRYTP